MKIKISIDGDAVAHLVEAENEDVAFAMARDTLTWRERYGGFPTSRIEVEEPPAAR